MLGTGPPLVSAAPQPPPTLIPLVYRPIPRASRPRSASPTSFADVRRSLSAPIPDLGDILGTGRPIRRPHRAGRDQGHTGIRRDQQTSEGAPLPTGRRYQAKLHSGRKVLPSAPGTAQTSISRMKCAVSAIVAEGARLCSPRALLW